MTIRARKHTTKNTKKVDVLPEKEEALPDVAEEEVIPIVIKTQQVATDSVVTIEGIKGKLVEEIPEPMKPLLHKIKLLSPTDDASVISTP